ncbi:hypothetical protein PVAND_016883 [Polypedilum vanderplanki]|uniref:Uncharacterized protein n=1 Tax=Polypedilum vanderplanki TaxID=319348 RepID=A0A9J6BGJ3_POLVA|nr:hypothetical protein PVAND_016883 [Polypedilum vanderplanki]
MSSSNTKETTTVTIDLDEEEQQFVIISKTKNNAFDYYSAKYLHNENENLLEYRFKLLQLIDDHEAIMMKDLEENQKVIEDLEKKAEFYEQLYSDSSASVLDMIDVMENLKNQLLRRGETEIVDRLEEDEFEREE